MPAPRRHMQRREVLHTTRFLTFSCYRRLPLLGNAPIRDALAEHLEASRRSLEFRLFAWVIMPEHVHLLLMPPLPRHAVSDIMSRLKIPFAKSMLARWRERGARVLARLEDGEGGHRFWQRGGGYDRNIFSADEYTEKLNYIHHNPVARGLAEEPRMWRWSSAAWYAGDRAGPVIIDDDPRTFVEWKRRIESTE